MSEDVQTTDVADAIIELRELRADVERLTAEREATWRMVEQCYTLEPRTMLEREAKTNGFTFGLVQAVFSLWKREPKVADRDAQVREAFMAGYAAKSWAGEWTFDTTPFPRTSAEAFTAYLATRQPKEPA